MGEPAVEPLGPTSVVRSDTGQTLREDRPVATHFVAEEPSDAQTKVDRNSLPGQVSQRPRVPGMDPVGSLPAGGATSCSGRGFRKEGDGVCVSTNTDDREFGQRDPHSLSEDEIETLVDRYRPSAGRAPNFEEFLGSLKKIVKKVASKAVDLAKKGISIAAKLGLGPVLQKLKALIKQRYCQELWIGPDHAATFCSSLLSTNSPLTKLAPALTNGTSR